MLEGVRKDVVDDLVEVALVDPERLFAVGGDEREVDPLALGQLVEGLHDVPDEVDDVRLTEVQLHLAGVDLAQVHELVDDAVDAQAVAVHQVVGVLAGGVLLGLAHRAQRCHHQVERGADLVGEVGEQAEAQLLQFHLFLFVGAQLLLPEQVVQQQAEAGQQDQM